MEDEGVLDHRRARLGDFDQLGPVSPCDGRRRNNDPRPHDEHEQSCPNETRHGFRLELEGGTDERVAERNL